MSLLASMKIIVILVIYILSEFPNFHEQHSIIK